MQVLAQCVMYKACAMRNVQSRIIVYLFFLTFFLLHIIIMWKV